MPDPNTLMDASSQSLGLCIAAPSFYPTYGGAQLRYMRYLPGFRERGLDVHVVTGTPTAKEIAGTQVQEDWFSHRPGFVFPTESIKGTPVHRVRLPENKGWRRSIMFNQTLVRFCKNHLTRPYVLQMVTHLYPLAIPWLLRLRAMGIPLIYAETLAPSAGSKKPLKRALRESNLRRLYNQLDCIITNNEPLKDMVRKLGSSTRIEAIPNGVDLERFRPHADGRDRHAVRQRLGIDDTDLVIAAVGAIIPRKRVDVLLEAWLKLVQCFPNTHVLLVGPETHLEYPKLTDFRRRMEELGRSSGAPERVHYTGIVDDVDVYLRASDIFILPSEREGLPNSVLEAMAVSLPVVITPFIGLSDDLGTAGEHYLICERNADAMAASLEKLLSDPLFRAEQGRRGRQWVVDTMDINLSLDRYVALYRELAEGIRKGTAG